MVCKVHKVSMVHMVLIVIAGNFVIMVYKGNMVNMENILTIVMVKKVKMVNMINLDKIVMKINTFALLARSTFETWFIT